LEGKKEKKWKKKKGSPRISREAENKQRSSPSMLETPDVGGKEALRKKCGKKAAFGPEKDNPVRKKRKAGGRNSERSQGG